VHSLLLAAALMAPGLEVTNDVTVTRPDGSAVPIAPHVRVACGPWADDAPKRSIGVQVGTPEGFWKMSAVVADVKRRPVVRFPHTFVSTRPSRALLFTADSSGAEASSAEEESSGWIKFQRVRCGRRLAVRFRVRAVLGSEFIDGEPRTLRGSFRASADL
jgi:hypothetical protein